jgi:hypothetical protein
MRIPEALERSSLDDHIVREVEDETEYANYYRHVDCPVNTAIEWEGIWTATCDDECPACGAAISPYKSKVVHRHEISNHREPDCGWHDKDLFSVSYEDIEVLIDRQIPGEVEIRVWRSGKLETVPYAKMVFDIDTFVCSHCSRDDVTSAECDKCEFCTICCSH